VGQLAKQLADRPSSSFGANTEKNPKEECKAVMTRSRWANNMDEEKTEKKMVEEKQQLVTKPTFEPVIESFKLEDVEEADDDQKNEKIINEGDEEIKEKEEKEKKRKRNRKRKK